MTLLPKPVYLIIVGSIFMCRSPNTIAESNSIEPVDSKKTAVVTILIAPEYARIRAVIKSIDPPVLNGKVPCNLLPCFAIVVVEEVVGYGSSFSHTINAGDQLHVQFVVSIKSSKEAYPNKQSMDLPGISLEQSFLADIEGNPFEKNNPVFKIYSYQLIK